MEVTVALNYRLNYKEQLLGVFGSGSLRKALFLDLLLVVIQDWITYGEILLLNSLFTVLDRELETCKDKNVNDDSHFRHELTNLVDWCFDAKDDIHRTCSSTTTRSHNIMRAHISALLCCTASILKDHATAEVFEKVRAFSSFGA